MEDKGEWRGRGKGVGEGGKMPETIIQLYVCMQNRNKSKTENIHRSLYCRHEEFTYFRDVLTACNTILTKLCAE